MLGKRRPFGCWHVAAYAIADSAVKKYDHRPLRVVIMGPDVQKQTILIAHRTGVRALQAVRPETRGVLVRCPMGASLVGSTLGILERSFAFALDA